MKNTPKRVCLHCDFVMDIPEYPDNSVISCVQCEGKLFYHQSNAIKRLFAYSFSALIMLFLSLLFSVLQINIAGLVVSVSFFDIFSDLKDYQFYLLAIAFVVFVFVLPFIFLFFSLILAFPLFRNRFLNTKLYFLRVIFYLKDWTMPEIFLTGVLVSCVKLISYGEIGFNLSFFPFCLFTIFYIMTLIQFERSDLWEEFSPQNQNLELESGRSALSQEVKVCACCKAISSFDETYCYRCGLKIEVRKKNSLVWTFSLLVTGIIFYIPANIMSIMDTITLGDIYRSSIMQGVVFMWQGGSYPVALIIFIASIVIPILKMIALFFLCWFYKFKKNINKEDCLRMQWVYDAVEFVGRWSMIDVFVVIVVSGLIHIGTLMNIYPALGVIFFGTVVVITMIAAKKFDSRLIWDRIYQKNSDNII